LITSRRILPEENDEAARLHSGLVEYFNPRGLIEFCVITDVLINQLIKIRIDQAFTREFSRAAMEKAIQWNENYDRSGVQYIARLGKLNIPRRDHRERMRPEICIIGLEQLRKQIIDRGLQPEEDLATLSDYYGDEPTRHVAMAMDKLRRVTQQTKAQGGSADASSAADVKKKILEWLEIEITFQHHLEGVEADRDALEYGSDPREPASPMLDTLLRYRAANIREFRDLLDCLVRLRSLRRAAS